MSVFFQNTCPYSSCRRSYFCLSDLIVHIENDHLDFDPNNIKKLEAEKPENIPLSYVLKFSNSERTKPQYSQDNSFNESVIHEIDDVGANEVVSVLNNNYIGEFQERKIESEERLSQEVAHISNELFVFDETHKKPFLCNMRGCEKRYKNVNGIKYHYKKHHKMLIPTLKKTLLKHKSFLSAPKTQFETHDLHGIPLYSYQSPIPDFVYHNHQHPNTRHLEEYEAGDIVYQLPTSEANVNQVPLANTSFNYYNVLDVGDTDVFSGRNSAYFVPKL